LLRREYHVKRIAVFGSLVRSELFHPTSDIDLVVWGLDEKQYYRAAGRLLVLDPAFEIDLLRGEDVPTSLLTTIEMESEAL
jgi:predicted nucleotidyltransferase